MDPFPDQLTDDLFAGSTDAHALARAVDWNETSIGPPESWPGVLRNAVRLCMESPAPMAVWVGPEYVLIHNEGYRLVLGDKASWAMGRPAREVWSEVWAELETDFDRVREAGVSVRYENQPYVVRRNDRDEQTYFTYMLAPIGEPGTAVLGLFNVCEETTQTIRALAYARDKYRTLIESMDYGFGVAELTLEGGHVTDYCFVDVNSAFLAYLGLPVEVGTSMTAQRPEIDHRSWMAMFEHVSCTGESIRYERFVPRLNRYFDGYMFRVGAPDDRQIGVLFSDITDRKRAEQSLRENADRHALLLRLADDLRSLTEPGEIELTAARVFGEYLHANRVFHADVIDEDTFEIIRDYTNGVVSLAGRHPISGLGDAALNILRRGQRLIVDDVRTDERLKPAVRESLLVLDVAASMSTGLIKNGHWVALWGVHSATPRTWTPAEIALLDEVAERTWFKTEHARQEQRKSEFLGVLSHELRNPLAAIHNSLRLLERTEPGSSRAVRAMDIMRRQATQLSRLVDDLLDLTRISNGKVALQRERVDLCEIVNRTVDDMRPMFEEAKVALHNLRVSHPIWVDADAVRLAQVLSNLLHNAVKFTPAGGEVTVAITTHEDTASLHVRDTGEGISPPMLERVFQPFEQAEQGLARTRGGLGLGLPLVRGLVELHGGKVEAHSEGLGQGAEFVVTLPTLATARDAESEAEPAFDPNARDILVIDDNLDAAHSLADLLEIAGHHVRVAGDGLTGLALAREHAPQFVLCDIGLPDISGYEVAERMRADPELRGTQLIAVTGYAQPDDRQRASAAGFDAHLAKPLSLEHLEALLS